MAVKVLLPEIGGRGAANGVWFRAEEVRRQRGGWIGVRTNISIALLLIAFEEQAARCQTVQRYK